MRYKYAHLFGRISTYLFFHSRKDSETLRNDLRAVEHDLPRAFIRTMKRHGLIDALAANIFGNEPLIEYKAYVAEDKRLEQFVQGQISADKV